jgi:ATP-binding cassette subfamily B (MDR/TAP) protein 8
MLSKLLNHTTCRISNVFDQQALLLLRKQINTGLKQWKSFNSNLLKNESVNLGKTVKALRLSGITLGISYCLSKSVRNGYCKTKNISSRVVENKNPITIHPLTWSDIWEIIKPYFHFLLFATAGAIVVALLNIRLPILLGDLVNVIAGLLTNKNELQFETINPIAGKLLGLYVAQAIFTFLYITSLSIMGERMAADLRVKLLNKLLHHDMYFFDEQRTGELNDRLNNDVQEFKSSFKLCVAQGLRTFAQTSGCIISLYFISPTMTMLTVGIVPMVILVGTFCGALLRKISLAAQAQSARASGVAEEAMQNIRTVKAFAMIFMPKKLMKLEL